MNRVPEYLVRTKSDEAAIDQGCWFDQAAADKVRYFFERFLRHSKGQFAGKPFELLPWQWTDVVQPLFGWKRVDGARRFTRCGIGIAKKNGKSTLLAGLGLYLLCWDEEAGAEVYSAAADRMQASIIFNECVAMVDASPALQKRIRVKASGKRMTYGHSSLQALSADVPTKEGLNIHGLLFDELHAQPNDKLWNTLRYGGAARRQPLLFWISTAGISRETIGWKQWAHATAVLSGDLVDVGFLPVIYAAKPEADWASESAFRDANPSYGVTISERDWQEAVAEAIGSAAAENNYRRYRLNQWVGQMTRWIRMSDWHSCRGNVTEETEAGKRCWIGLDLAATTDVAAAVAWFKDRKGHRMLPRFWLPEAALEGREASNRARWQEWAKRGIVIITPGSVLDYERIRADLNTWGDKFDVKEVAIDPWNATQLATQLVDDGFEVTFVRTGFASISAATKEFEKLVLGRELTHPGDPCLDFMVENVAVEMDASGNLKPSKKAAAEKIDGVVAGIIALARVIQSPAAKKSKYEDQKLVTT